MHPLRLASTLLLCLPGLASAQDTAVRPWEHESSDLPVDPRFHFGHFENGLRWVWARNGEPKYRSYLRLHVDAGSLAEEDSERGMAHFLEHMAFNGSEHFPAGTLVEWFQRHGMAFGADLNAHTSFSETVFELDLPTSDEKTLDEGLLVLRDFAFGLTLAPEEVEKEKGVIDGEERERDSASYRLFVRQLREVFGETLLDDRVPIGVQSVRAAFTPEKLRSFLGKWYRPERMTLVLVGDLGELDPVPLFTKHFGSVARPAESLVPEPGPGRISDFSYRLCFAEPEIPSVSIRLAKIRPWAAKAYDSARWRDETPLAAARDMLDIRFDELVKEADAPFLSAGAASAETFDVIDGEELRIACAPEKWKEALSAGEQELRRALEHGFQEAELAEVRANSLRNLDEAVERERTRTSASLVQAILLAAETRYVPTAAETQRALQKPVYETLTAEQCHAALVAAWGRGELALSTAGKLDLGATAEQELDAALEASRAVEVAKNAAIEVAEFAYAPEPDPALDPPPFERVEDLDFVRTRFANGVTLNVKRTDFKEKQILFRVLLGEGRLSLPARDLPLGWMADRVFEDGGLGAHTIDELRRILAGKEVGLSFQVDLDSFVFGGATTREDLVLQCALVCAYLRDAAWRDDGFVRVRRELPLVYEGLQHQHQGPVVKDFMSALFAGDERFAFFPQEKLAAVELESVRAWLVPFLADAPLEVTLVGDLDPEAVRAAVALTFGRLPARRALRPYEEQRVAPAPRSGVHQEHSIDTQVPKSLVLIAFPMPDGIDIARSRHAAFLAEVLRDRLRIEVRERLGAAYSPTAVVNPSRLYPGVGLLFVQAMTDPGKAKELHEACLAVTDALAKDGVAKEEVERLREPVLKRLRDERRQNGWWLGILAESQRRPAALDEARSQMAFFESLGAEPLTELARARLAREKSSSVIVNPSAKTEAKPAGGETETEKDG